MMKRLEYLMTGDHPTPRTIPDSVEGCLHTSRALVFFRLVLTAFARKLRRRVVIEEFESPLAREHPGHR
jgi:hypothetical protein